MRNEKLRLMVLTAVFAAIIFVTTYMLHINTPFNGGYVHPGDAFIYLAACLLPTPYAAAASSIGAALSDLLASPIYVLPTLIVKAVLTLFFTSLGDRILTRRNIAGVFLAGLTGLFGYFIAESIMFNVQAAAVNALFGALQPLVSGIVFVLIGAMLDRTGFKKRFHLNPPKSER